MDLCILWGCGTSNLDDENMNVDAYKAKRKELIKLVENNFVDDRGVVVQGVDCHLFNDLGDYLPFFAYYGRKKICETQLKRLPEYIAPSGLLKPREKLVGVSVNTVYEHTDLVLGLVDYYQQTGDRRSLKMAEKITMAVVDKFNLVECKSSFWVPSINMRIPIFDSKASMFVELLATMYGVTEKKVYLNLAEEMARNISKLMERPKKNLLVNVYSPFNKLFTGPIKQQTQVYSLVKYNVNALNAFLCLYQIKPSEILKSQIESMVDKLIGKFTSPSGGVYSWIGEFGEGKVSLTSNFALLDAVCDAIYIFNKTEWLDFVQKLGDYWLKVQSKKTGLMQFVNEGSDYSSYLDSETDMAVALVKLSELSGKIKYKSAAKKLFEGILNYHFDGNGYVLKVNVRSGKVTDRTYKTKFMCLLLKAFILFEKPEQKIYGNKRLFEILKDR